MRLLGCALLNIASRPQILVVVEFPQRAGRVRLAGCNDDVGRGDGFSPLQSRRANPCECLALLRRGSRFAGVVALTSIHDLRAALDEA